ncbi:MAG: nucleotidyl transferase AbiEii/AbiGii toxin family protein [Desulfobacterales bacterium]|nr:nucleotidyl transferase AbiEii/AbiGii toxin family protein [Desulfobacterales bacterium]
MEFEQLAKGEQPEFQRHILRDLPQIPGLLSSGRLVLPYTSSIVLAETTEEILSDKIRALFERIYIKGRDVYDVWWLFAQMGVRVSWPVVKRKLGLYRAPFQPARELDFFHSEAAAKMLINAMRTDLPRFIPPAPLSVYQEDRFTPLINALRQVIADLIDQGMILNPVAAP